MNLENSVPIPQANRYKFEDWKVGDSHFFQSLVDVERCYAAAYAFGRKKKNGMKMLRRKEGDGYRLWRVK